MLFSSFQIFELLHMLASLQSMVNKSKGKSLRFGKKTPTTQHLFFGLKDSNLADPMLIPKAICGPLV